MKKENNSGIIELEAEEMLSEGSLENVIENTLIKANVTDKVLAALKEKYSGIKLRDVEDKETYLEAKEARKEVRKVGIITEKICKAGREDAVKIQKMWLSKEKEILGKIAEVQDPLDSEIKKFDDEIERKEQEEQKRKEEKWINRQAVLTKYGATYQDGSFVLKHISYEAELIKSSEEDTWNDTILPKYRKVYEEIESERVAEENKRKLEQERLQKEREAFEEQQRLFKKQQDEFNKQREEQEKRIRLEQEQKESAERQRLQLRTNERYKQLQLLGMQYNGSYGCFVYEDINVDNNTEVNIFDDEKWNELINKITPFIEERKKDAEQKRLAKIEEDIRIAKEQAVKAERERLEREQKEAELRKQQEEQRKQEELAQASDKVKWEAFVLSVKSLTHSEMKSPIYRRKQSQAKELLEQIINL